MNNPKNKNEIIDLGAIARICREKWYIFLACFVGCVAIGLLYVRTHNPEYLVRAKMLVTSDKGDTEAGAMGSLSSLFGSSVKVDDEVFAVSSHSVFKDVVKKHSLNKLHITRTGFLKSRFDLEGYPIDIEYNPAIVDTLRSTMVFTVKVNDKGLASIKIKARNETLADVKDQKLPCELNTQFGDFKVVATKDLIPDESVKSTILLMGYDLAAETLDKGVAVEIPNRRANVIELQLVSENIDYAKAVLNSIIELYNRRGIAQDNLKNQNTIKFIDSRLALLSTDLTDVEGNIENLKSEQGIVDLEAEIKYQFAKKGQLEVDLVAAETQYEIFKMIRDFLAEPQNATDLVPASLTGSSNNTGDNASSAINAYNELVLQRMRIASTAKPGNTALKAMDEQLDAMRTNLVATLTKSMESSKIAIDELRGKFGSAKNALEQVPAQERVMRDIFRQRSIKEQIYIFLLQEREKVSMLLANGSEKGKVIDEAYALTEEVGMSNKMILAVAGFIGILLGFLIVYVQNLLRTKFSNKNELEELTSAPILGEVSLTRSKEALVVKPKSTSSTAELFRLVRSNLLFMLGSPDNKVVLMTSTKSGEGKSFISINLAASLAMLDKKVLLIGLDIRKPRLAEYLNMPPTPGFTTYIAGGSSLTIDQILHKDALISGLDVIFAGPIPPNPAELLVSDAVDEFFKEMRKRYDYIIIDSAPVGMVSDSLALARVADATVYVCRADYTTKSDIRLFADMYENKRLPKVSLVLNGTVARQGYGYGYGEDKQ